MQRARTIRAMVFLSALGFVLLTALVWAGWEPLVQLDRTASRSVRRFGAAHPGWVSANRAVTRVGDGAWLLAAGVVLTVLLTVLRRYRAAVLVAAVAAGTHVLSIAVKASVRRHRPTDPFEAVDWWAYPSGHTVHASAAVLIAVHLAWSHLGRIGRRVAVVTAAVVAFAVGASRVFLLAHWPSDVLAGWLLVAAGGTGAALWVRGRRRVW